MSTARERLSLLRKMHVGVPGTQISERPTETTIMVDCVIEITDALLGSQQAINDMANRVVTVSNNMTGAIDKAREQMEQASRESTKAAEESINAAQESAKAAKESANLARKLNMLTVWIAIAAIVSRSIRDSSGGGRHGVRPIRSRSRSWCKSLRPRRRFPQKSSKTIALGRRIPEHPRRLHECIENGAPLARCFRPGIVKPRSLPFLS